MDNLKEKYVGFGLVRDAAGNPKVDDPDTLHPIQVLMMAPDERTELGLWAGAWARDAQGFKRLTRVSGQKFLAEDDLVSVSEVFDEDNWLRVNGRPDVPAGINLIIQLEN